LIDSRLTNLEVKATLTEDALDQLNEVIVRQQRQIDFLMREFARLQLENSSASQLPVARSLFDELPPHY
jgi:SlyX protein